MSDYLKRKKKDGELRNIYGQTVAEYRKMRSEGKTISDSDKETAVQNSTTQKDHELRNVYGQTVAEYRKMRNEGGKMNSLDKWKGETENLLREYNKYSYSGNYQTQEEHDSFSKRLKSQLENTVSLKEKYKENTTEIDEIVSRISDAIKDNDEGYEYYSQWDDDETYQQFLRYQQENEKYNNAEKQPDFEKNSRYVEPEGLKSIFRDQNYEYINNTEWSPKYLGDGNGDISVQEKKGYDYITDDERQKYNYIYNTQGKDKAKEYLDELNLTERMANDVLEEKQEYAEEHPVLASAESVVKNVYGGGMGFAESAVSKLMGKEIDPNSYANLINRTSGAMRESVAEEIDSKVGSFLYQTGMSMADSVAAMAATAWTGPLGLNPGTAAGFVLGSNAATSAMLDAKERGVSDGQALATGIAQGAAEMFFEKYSIGELKALKDVPVKTLKNAIGNVLRQAGVEGSEEVFTSMANALTDQIINGDLSENSLNTQNYMNQGYAELEARVLAGKDYLVQLFTDFLGGAISGGVMASGTQALNYAANKNQNYEEMQENAPQQSMGESKEAEIEPETEMLPEELPEENEEAVTKAAEEDISGEMDEETAEEIPWEEAEMYSGDAKEDTKISEESEVEPAQPVKGIRSETKSMASPKVQAAIETVDTILQYGQVNDHVAADIVKNKDIKKALEDKAGVEITGTETEQKNAVKEIVKLYGERHGSTASQARSIPVASSGRQNATVKGRGVEIIGVQSENGSNPKFKAADGKSYTYEEVSFANDNTKKLYSDAAALAMVADSEVANEYIKSYDSSYPVVLYQKGFYTLYNAGKNGVPVQESLKAMNFAVENTSESVMRKAWELGYKARTQEDSKVEVKKKQQTKKGKGTFEDQTRQGGPVAEIARLVADRTGIDIVRKSNLEHNANAAFIPSTMTLLLSENAQNEYTSLIHELGEFGLSYNREGMKQLQEAIIKYWAEKNGKTGLDEINEFIKDYQRRYAAVEGSKTKAQAMDEIINDALGGLFSTEAGVDEFIQWLQKDSGYNQTEQRTIVERVIDILDKVVEYLKDLVKGSNLTRAAQKAAQMEEQRAKEIRKMFLDALDVAVENANTTGEYTTDAAIKNSLKNFAEQYDAWDKKTPNNVFDVTIATDVYDFLGVKDRVIKFDASKIIKIRAKHEGMSDVVIKQIPEILNRPVLIMKSKSSDTRIVVTGMLLDENNKPVVAVLELKPQNRKGIIVDEIKVASAYGKDGMQNFINKSEILYTNPDKQIISRWAKHTRLQLPVGKASTDYNNIVSDKQENATHEMKFSLPEEYDELRRENESLIRENETFKQVIDSLESRLNIQKGVTVSKESIEKVADKLYKKYKSSTDKADFTERVAALFQSGETSKGNFLFLAEQIMRPVLENSKNNQEISDYNKGVLKDIRKTSIKLDGMQKNEVVYHYGTYNDFRKSLFGRANFSDKGTSLDILWKQWSETYPELFDADLSPVDQPMRLSAIIGDLKENYVSEYGFVMDDAVSYAAMELMNEYASLPEVKKLTDRASDAEFRTKYWRMTNTIKKDYQEQLKVYKAQMRETRAERTERQEKKKYKDSIIKSTKAITKLFEQNTDKYHVPEILRETTMNFLKSMDFLTENGWNTQDTIQLQNRLNILYRKFSAEENSAEGSSFMQDIDPDFLPTMDGLISLLENSGEVKKIADMNSAQLKEIAYLVGTLKRTIATANKLIGNKQYEHVSQLGDSSISHMEAMKAKKHLGKWLKMGDEMLNTHMLDSFSFFEQMGEGAKSVLQEIREGFNKRVWMLKEAQEYMQEVIGETKIKNWTGKKAELHEFDCGGQKFELTTGQLMNLYVLSKRPQALDHLMAKNGSRSESGGFTIDTQSAVKGQKMSERRIKVDKLDLDRMFEKLTPEQKKMADSMQKFLANNCSEWGNEVSMTLYGYKKFGEKTYWPIKTNENFNKTDDKNANSTGGDNTSLYAIRNQGMTKNLVKNANNPIVVGDIFDVFSEHVANMANYNAFVAPLSDAMKWFNYRSITEEGAVSGSIKEEMERAFGVGGKKYFVNFIKDVNGEVKKGVASEISSTFTSKYKAAAVGANMRVVLQQPTAYFRAAAVMDPKYLAAGLGHLPAIKEMQENSAIAIWKSWGYFETGLGQSMKQVLTGDSTTVEKIVEASMAGAGKADDLTWGVLWNAVKAEVKDKNKGIDVSSQEFMELVSKRFDEVVDQTQVVDTVLHRSQIMRSGDGVVKMAVAFMAEPTKSYNLLHSAARKTMEHNTSQNRAEVARRAAVYAFTGIMTAVAASFMDAFRDDDEEKEWAEKYIENFWANVKENLNPISQIPYLKEIGSLWEGYDSSRTDMAGISSLITAVQQAIKYANGEGTKNLYGVIKGIIRGLSQTTGIPLYNALRDTESLIEQFTFAPIDEKERTGKTVRIRLLKAMRGDNDKQLKKYLAWYDEQYQEKIADGKSDKDARAALKSSITSQYKEIYQNSNNAEKIKIKQLLLKISVGGKQLYKDYDWSNWDKKKEEK